MAYAALFALFGTTYGAGDGSTTFNLPDLRGRSRFAMDNMGGSAASRVTVAGSNIDGTVFGNTGGADGITLTTPQLPVHSHANSLTDPGHNHTFTGNPILGAGGTGLFVGQAGSTVTTATSTTGITITNANAGSGSSHSNMPPTFLCNVMIKT